VRSAPDRAGPATGFLPESALCPRGFSSRVLTRLRNPAPFLHRVNPYLLSADRERLRISRPLLTCCATPAS
jgi:hypothetical protein